jgi:hypothetical protein
VVNGGQAVSVTAKILGITKAKRYVKQGQGQFMDGLPKGGQSSYKPTF